MVGGGGSPGYHIYCIIQTDAGVTLTLPSIGSDALGVTAIRFMDLAAVVSPTSGTTDAIARDPKPVHQLVLEALIKRFTLLPVKSGTVAGSTEDVVEKLLKRRYSELQCLLSYLNSKVELGLSVRWERESMFAQIMAENPIIRRVQAELVGRPEAETRWGHIQLGEMVARAVEIKRQEESAHLLAVLKPLTDDLKVNKPLTDMVILDGAFLVPRGKQTEFDARVNELDQRYAGHMLFRRVGPVPPVSFVQISAQQG